jgi:hypothetical protein
MIALLLAAVRSVCGAAVFQHDRRSDVPACCVSTGETLWNVSVQLVANWHKSSQALYESWHLSQTSFAGRSHCIAEP